MAAQLEPNLPAMKCSVYGMAAQAHEKSLGRKKPSCDHCWQTGRGQSATTMSWRTARGQSATTMIHDQNTKRAHYSEELVHMLPE